MPTLSTRTLWPGHHWLRHFQLPFVLPQAMPPTVIPQSQLQKSSYWSGSHAPWCHLGVREEVGRRWKVPSGADPGVRESCFIPARQHAKHVLPMGPWVARLDEQECSCKFCHFPRYSWDNEGWNSEISKCSHILNFLTSWSSTVEFWIRNVWPVKSTQVFQNLKKMWKENIYHEVSTNLP